MLYFPENANLPSGRVDTVIMSDKKQDIINELRNNYHIETITPMPVTGICGSEKYHADMSVCHIGGKLFFADSGNQELIKTLSVSGAEVITSERITAESPKLNVCILKDKLICNTKTADKSLIQNCKDHGKKIVHTKQRYAKCSTAVISENAVITADESIARVCHAEKIDVLKISVGQIMLDGYDYGFIGGCCGFISKYLLAFSGDVRKHTDYENIRSFAGNYGINLVSLGNEVLYDVGGIIPVSEKK